MDTKLERKLIKEFPQLFQGCPEIMKPTVKGFFLRINFDIYWFFVKLPVFKQIIRGFQKLKRKSIKPKQRFIDNLMYFGVDCGNGWYHLIRKLCQDIMVVLPSCSLDEEDRKLVGFEQIKEKWGLLRIYYHPFCDEIDDLIDKAEMQSAKICERCGSTENITITTGWIQHLCPDCLEERPKRLMENFEEVVKMLEEK